MLTDQVGVIVGSAAHPYRLPAEYARVAGMPLVQYVDSWPFLYASARRAGIQGNEPFDITEELTSVQEQAGELVRAYGVGLLLPDQTPRGLRRHQ
jgi:hypothetical protein